MEPQTTTSTPAPVMCTGCNQITDPQGKTVWACENCGAEQKMPEVQNAQAAVDAAAAAAGAAPITTPPKTEGAPATTGTSGTTA